MTNRHSNGKIYKLVNDVDDEIYVGSTCMPLAKRMHCHKRDVTKYPERRVYKHSLAMVFEELPRFSDNEWEAISSQLKDYKTGSETLYADKNEKQFKARNINNYIINSNVDAIKRSEGRRISTIRSTKR